MKGSEMNEILLDLSTHGVLDGRIHPETRQKQWEPAKQFFSDIQKCAEKTAKEHPRTKPERAVELGILEALIAHYPEGLTTDQITERVMILRAWFGRIFSRKRGTTKT